MLANDFRAIIVIIAPVCVCSLATAIRQPVLLGHRTQSELMDDLRAKMKQVLFGSITAGIFIVGSMVVTFLRAWDRLTIYDVLSMA